MHVCLLSSNGFPPNERIRKEAAALREAGNAVTACVRGTSDEDERDIVAGIDVRRLPDETLYTGIRGAFDGLRYALQYVHPAWVRAVSEVDDERTVDVCCVCDLSLVKTGLRAGKTLDVPVVCDLGGPLDRQRAEPERESRGGRLRGLARRAFHPSWRRKRLETNALPEANRLVTTCEEARARYVREKGIDPRRVAVVRDTAEHTPEAEPDRPAGGLGFEPAEAFVVTAFGEVTPEAGFEALIKAAARAADSVVDLQLVVVGDGDAEYLADLDTLARRRLAGGRVTFRTAAGSTDTAGYVAASDVCVFPSPSETTVPPELYEAMAMGVPVVVGDADPAERLLGRTNAGRVVPDGDRETLTESLIALDDADLAAELGANGRAAAKGEYRWEHDAGRLRALYVELTGPNNTFVSAMR